MQSCNFFDRKHLIHPENHLGLDPELREHITVHYYESGHMMYIHQPSMLKLKQ